MEFFVMPLSDQLPESFSDLTDREIQIACRFALEIIKGIAWFPLPVGVGEEKYTDDQMKYVAIGHKSAWETGRDLVLPIYVQKMEETRAIKTVNYGKSYKRLVDCS